MRLAVIPARGGSQRIPRKNIKEFCGQPIIAYSIQAARNCGLFDRVIVSTDDEEIAAVARDFDAETPFLRPTDLADDFTGTNAVVHHALEWFKEQGTEFEHACCIYATAPFIDAEILQRGYRQLLDTDADFAFSVTTYEFPIQRSLRMDDDGRIDAMYPEFSNTRSQDLEEAWHDAAQFYWGKAAAFIEDRPMMSPLSTGVVIPRERVQDIDTPEDWQRAVSMYRTLIEHLD